MSYCTAINCMDGRVQEPVTTYLRQRYKADYVDMITEAGPVALFSEGADSLQLSAIHSRVGVSVEAHDSSAIAIIAHAGCVGNPIADDDQIAQLRLAVEGLRHRYASTDVIGLWIGGSGSVEELSI